MTRSPEDLLDESARCLCQAKHIVVLTGAGISAESGIPTFRDALTGLWAKYNPADLATPEAFARDPQRVTRWYDERRLQVARCIPNSGHRTLVQMQQMMLEKRRRFTLITQNVDRLHQAAGSINVIELHGSLWLWRCTQCGRESEQRGPAFTEYPPRCDCGRMLRPGVVWFGEPLPQRAMEEAREATEQCDFFMSVGTSAMVYPAAGLIDQAFDSGIKTLEVNTEPTPMSRRVTWALEGRSGDVLPRLMQMATDQAIEP